MCNTEKMPATVNGDVIQRGIFSYLPVSVKVNVVLETGECAGSCVCVTEVQETCLEPLLLLEGLLTLLLLTGWSLSDFASHRRRTSYHLSLRVVGIARRLGH